MKVKMWFSGNPIPKGRARVVNGHVYTPDATAFWEETVGWQCKAQFNHRPFLGPLGIEFIFYRENQRKVDLDNLEKSMLDGLQGILYEDDSQIKEKRSELHQGCARPGVEVYIWPL